MRSVLGTIGCVWSPSAPDGPIGKVLQLVQEVFKGLFKYLSKNCQTFQEQGL